MITNGLRSWCGLASVLVWAMGPTSLLGHRTSPRDVIREAMRPGCPAGLRLEATGPCTGPDRGGTAGVRVAARRRGLTVPSEGTVDPGGQIDMQQLLAAAQQMQDQLMNAQQELADAVVEGSAGGGLVKAKVNGQGDLVDLTISPAAIDGSDPAETAQTIADLVLAAVRDANRAAGELQQEKMGPLASGIGGLGGAGDVPGLSGIPGLGDVPGQPHGGEPRGDGDLGDLRG